MANGISRARLAIPKVQQNPKPPVLRNGGLTAPRPTKGLANAVVAAKAPRPSNAPSAALTKAANNITNTNFSGVTAAGSTGSTAAAAAGTPAPEGVGKSPRFTLPTFTPAAGEADPRDPKYWENVAKLEFTDNQAWNKSEAEEAASNSGYNLALQQAIRGRGVQERELGENAIKGNLGASGWLGRNQAEQSTTYAEERGAAARGHEGEQQAFAAARKALQEGFGIEAAEALAEAAGRKAESAAEETESGAPEAAPSPIATVLGGANKKPKQKNAIGNANALRPGQAIGKNRKAK